MDLQVVGLTASVGVGGAKTPEKVQEHILKLMASLDAEELCIVKNKRNKLELMTHVNRPNESIIKFYICASVLFNNKYP